MADPADDRTLSRRAAGFILVFIVGAAIARGVSVLAFDRVPPIYDVLELSRASLLLARGLMDFDGRLLDEFFRVAQESAFPPLVHYTALPVTALFHHDLAQPVWSFGFFTALIILSVYSLARRIGGRRAGLPAAALVMTAPGLDGFSRVYLTDYPLTALVIAACAIAFASDGFRSRKRSLVAGVVAGLGMIAKQSFPLYAGPPLLLYACLSFWAPGDEPDRPRRAQNIALAAAVASAIALTWIVPHFRAFLLDRDAVNAFYRAAEPHQPDMIDHALMLWKCAGTVLCAAALAGAFWSSRDRRAWAIIAAVLAPLVALRYFFPMSTPRYLLPLVPSCAVLAGLAVARLPRRASIGAALILVTAAVGLLATRALYEPRGPLDTDAQHARFQETGALRPQFTDDAWIEPLAATIAEQKPARVLLLLDSPATEALQAALWERDLLFPVVNLFEMAGIGRMPARLVETADIEDFLRASDLILVAADAPSGGPLTYAPQGGVPEHYAERVFGAFDAVRSDFAQITQSDDPTGLLLRLFARRPKPEPPPTP